MTPLGNFDPAVVELLTSAQDEARAVGHGYIGTEHVLAALLQGARSRAVEELRTREMTAKSARPAARRAFEETDQPMTYIPPEDALATVGIDLVEARRRTEEQFGPGSLSMRVGAPAFTPKAKQAVDAAAERAAAQGRESAGIDDLVLGLLDDPTSVASRAVSAIAGDLDELRASISTRTDGSGAEDS